MSFSLIISAHLKRSTNCYPSLALVASTVALFTLQHGFCVDFRHRADTYRPLLKPEDTMLPPWGTVAERMMVLAQL